jgi:hypothetical protein
MLTVPQMPTIPVANLIRAVPMKVSKAYLSACLNIANIDKDNSIFKFNLTSAIEQVHIALVASIQRSPLIFLVQICQNHMFGMPS